MVVAAAAVPAVLVLQLAVTREALLPQTREDRRRVDSDLSRPLPDATLVACLASPEELRGTTTGLAIIKVHGNPNPLKE